MTFTIEQRAGFPTIIGPSTLRQATEAEIALMAERDALRAEVERLQSDTVAVPRGLLERLAGSPDLDPDCCVAYYRQQLRALLAGGVK